MPNRFDGSLRDADLAGGVHDQPIFFDSAQSNGFADFRQRQAGLGDGDGRADINSALDLCAKIQRCPMAPGVERDNPFRFRPLRVGDPIWITGSVSLRSGREAGSSAPEETANAR